MFYLNSFLIGNNLFLLLGTSIFIFGILYLSSIAQRRNIISAEASRRTVHVFVGLIISSSPLIFSSNFYPFTIGLSFVFINLFALKVNALNGIHSQKRKSYGTIYFPLSFSIITFFFWEREDFIILSFLILSLSDSLAGYIGSKSYSAKKFRIWYDTKTFQGTLTFFITTSIILFIGIYYLKDYSWTQSLLFVLVISIFTTISEIVSKKGSDNLSIPLVCMLMMISLEEQFIIQQEPKVFLLLTAQLIFMTAILYLSKIIGALSLSGFLSASTVGCLLILYGIQFHFVLLASFFTLSLALNLLIKKIIIFKSKHSKRNVVQVLCNGGIPLLLCIISYFKQNPHFHYLFAASVATAMADTWATEFGKLSKVKPISIISLEKVSHGLSGGITLIGIIGSLIGSIIVGLLSNNLIYIEHYLTFGIILCGFFGSIIDSILGDIIQSKYITPAGEIIDGPTKDSVLISGYSFVDNNFVNFIATITGPLFMHFYISIV